MEHGDDFNVKSTDVISKLFFTLDCFDFNKLSKHI